MPQRHEKGIGRGFAALHILRADDIDEQLAKTGAAQDRFSLDAQGAGGQHQGKSACTCAHEVLGGGIKEILAVDQLHVARGLARDQFVDKCGTAGAPMLAHDHAEAFAIRVANQALEIILPAQFDSLTGQYFAKTLKVQRLGVDQGAVEIKNDGPNHYPKDLPEIARPERYGKLRRSTGA